MKVVMRLQVSGTRDGVDWPPVGTEAEFPDEEAELLIRNGIALPTHPGLQAALAEPVMEKAVIRPVRKRARAKE